MHHIRSLKMTGRRVSLLWACLLTVALLTTYFSLFIQPARAANCSVPSGSYGTIQAAIDDGACDTITIAAGTYVENLSIARTVTLVGAGSGSTIIDGDRTERAFYITGSSGTTVVISGTTIRNGYHESSGGGIYNNVTLHIINSIVERNVISSTANGGGIYNSGTLTVTQSLIRENEALNGIHRGAGIYNIIGDALIENSLVSGNAITASQAFGGGIYNSNGTMTIRDSIIRENSTSGLITRGSGIYNRAAMTVTNSEISANNSEGDGAGVYSSPIEDTLLVVNAQISDNYAEDDGAGIYSSGNSIIRDTTVISNTADGDGGGIYNSGPMTVTNSRFVNNTAHEDGAGISSSNSLFLQDSMVVGSDAGRDGGGLYAFGPATLERVTLYQNHSDWDGGGIAGIDSITLTNVTLSENSVNGSTLSEGGAMYVSGSNARVTISNSTIVSNTSNNASYVGGIVSSSSPTVTIENSILAHNTNANCDSIEASASAGNNLESADDCNFGASGDITNTLPILGPLQDNGGATWTHALLQGSPAVNAGNTATCATGDQRGVSRPQGAACDIGAVEAILIAIGDVDQVEGDSGPADAVFDVTLSGASPLPISAKYGTADGTATSGAATARAAIGPIDYQSQQGQLGFPIGTESTSVTIKIAGDTTDELDETFFVNLNDPTNAVVIDSQGMGTILDDDGPNVAISDTTVTEGDSGTTTARFTVTLDSSSVQTITVDYATGDQSAAAGSDYTDTSGTLTLTAGTTERSIEVPITGDTAVEPEETFVVTLSNADNATITVSEAVGTIYNDDYPSLSIGDAAITEGDAGTTEATFTVTLSEPSPYTATVAYETAAGSADDGTDFTTTSGTLTFEAGVTERTVSVDVIGDTEPEDDETFEVLLKSPTNATIGDSAGLGTITDNDGYMLYVPAILRGE